MGHTTWVMTQPCQRVCFLWKEREHNSHSRGYRNKFKSSFLWLPKSKSNLGCIFIHGNPYRGVLRVLTISSIFPPTLKCSYNSNNTANPLLSKQGTGFCLLFANHKPAHTKVWALPQRVSPRWGHAAMTTTWGWIIQTDKTYIIVWSPVPTFSKEILLVLLKVH